MPSSESDTETRHELQLVTMNEKSKSGLGTTYPPPPPNLEAYVVDFEGPEDPTHPYNWRLSTKYGYLSQTLSVQSADTIFGNPGFSLPS